MDVECMLQLTFSLTYLAHWNDKCIMHTMASFVTFTWRLVAALSQEETVFYNYFQRCFFVLKLNIVQ